MVRVDNFYRIDNMYCTGCGVRGVWREDIDRDFYCGPLYACTSCEFVWNMWEAAKAENDYETGTVNKLREFEKMLQ